MKLLTVERLGPGLLSIESDAEDTEYVSAVSFIVSTIVGHDGLFSRKAQMLAVQLWSELAATPLARCGTCDEWSVDGAQLAADDPRPGQWICQRCDGGEPWRGGIDPMGTP